MDEYSSKRAVNGLYVPRRGLRDIADSRDENVQLCSRYGCSSRLNSMKSPQVKCTEKPRPFKPSFTSSNGKDVVGSSSRTSSSARKSLKESHIKSFSHVENDQSETTCLHGEQPDVPRHMKSSKAQQPQFDSVMRDTGSSKIILAEVGGSSGASSSKPRRLFSPKYSNQNSPVGSSVSSSSKAIGAGTRGTSSGAGYVPRNLKCNSGSDVSLTTNSRFSRRDMVKRGNSEGESSSSSKGKKVSGASPKEGDVIRPTRGGITISDSRGSKNFDVRVDNRAVSVRTRRSMNVPRLRDSIRDSSSQPESLNLSLQSSSQFFSDASSSDSSAYSFPGNDVEDFPAEVHGTSADLGINQLINRDALQRYNMDGVAQVFYSKELRSTLFSSRGLPDGYSISFWSLLYCTGTGGT